jgi:Cdc6-like AAA superfamily ATPase
LDTHLSKKTPGSMYISGAPGTGKTAVLSKTLNRIQVRKSSTVSMLVFQIVTVEIGCNVINKKLIRSALTSFIS